MVENRQIEVLVLLRKLGNSDREKQGGTVLDITQTSASQREKHIQGESGIAGKRSRQLRKQPGGGKEEGADTRTQT